MLLEAGESCCAAFKFYLETTKKERACDEEKKNP